MDYLGILKKAYEITLKHKFLWIFGILGGGYGGMKMYNFSADNGDWNKILTDKNITDIGTYFTSHAGIFIPLLGVGMLLAVVFFILNIISQGALISSAAKLGRGEKSDFSDGFALGARNFWKILGIQVLFGLMILGVVILWAGPAILLVSAGAGIIGLIWGILLFFVFLAFAILVAIILPYSLRIAVLKKTNIGEAIREGLHFFQKNWGSVILMYLILFAVSIGFGIVFMIAVMVAGAILLLLGWLFYLISSILGIIYAILAGLAVIVAVVTIAGAYGAFSSTVLTLTYQKLVEK